MTGSKNTGDEARDDDSGWSSRAFWSRVAEADTSMSDLRDASVDRRLSAILCADIAGYSRMMAEDEEGTHSRLQRCCDEVVEPAITGHKGRIVKHMGDGVLAEFASVVNAARCAVAMQSSLGARAAAEEESRRMAFRIGINVGDVIVRDDDLFGDGVNVAARLQELSEPGGILISADAWRQVKGKLSCEAEDVGELALKNLPEPVSAVRLRVGNEEVARAFFEKGVLEQMDSLYGAALRMTRDAAAAEDLVAETVARAWSAFAGLKDRARFRAWLFRILTNSYISQYRKESAEPAVESWSCGDEDEDFSLFEKLHQPFLLWWGNPEQEFVNKLLREDIAKAIDELPDAFRITVMLVDVEGFSYQDAAEALEVPIGTIRSRLKRARACLQKNLWRHAAEIGAANSATEGTPGK